MTSRRNFLQTTAAALLATETPTTAAESRPLIGITVLPDVCLRMGSQQAEILL